MASSMHMSAPDTLGGLAAAAAARGATAGAGLPALPFGTYIAPYTAELELLLASASANLAAKVAFGSVTSAASVTSVETTEQLSTGVLTT
ncbi:hypothetical protein [Mycolicibacterium mageritense]|uniref:PE domain-containing protein n=2 Tax=Mycolicibacterium TaxID=1866885 RepID=A0A1X2FDD2_9MYCO|nr:hypothetical protein [Mycolicibacterium mageritense]ORV21641.1 hypothetical protein AWB98_26635 [Mycolicibacterium conceptionense]ORX15999.1 hypothetical protein AWC31_01115 [Mycolicibacterium wolinskyi]